MRIKIFLVSVLLIMSTFLFGQIIVTSDWEDGQLLAPGIKQETTTAYGQMVTDSVSREGKYACRFEARHGDPPYGGSVRSEQKTGDILRIGQEIWQGYSMMYDNTMTNTNKDEIVGQWHQKNELSQYGGPAIGIHNKGDFNFYVYARLGVGSKGVTLQMGNVPKGEWVDFVWNIRFATDDTGFIKCWINGEQRIDYKGACGYIGGNGINFKFGIYPGFKTDYTSQSPRIIYWDDLKIADSTATYNDVNPGSVDGRKSQIITFPPIPNKHLTDPVFDPGAMASSGLPITYTSSDTLVAKVVQEGLRVVGIGTTIITASQNGNDSYFKAIPVSQGLKVSDTTKQEQTITFVPIGDKLTIDPDFNPGAISSAELPVVYFSSDTLVATILNDMVHIKNSGKVMITATQPGNEYFNPAENVSQNVTINAPSGLPKPWVGLDIGSPQITGQAFQKAGFIEISAGGNDVWSGSDQCHFVYQKLGEECSDQTINPAQDAYIRNDFTASGTDTIIYTKNGGGSYYREGYLMFNLSFMSCSLVESAKLRLYCNQADGGNAELYQIDEDNWEETVIGWDNKPVQGTIIGSLTGKKGTLQWDVTEFVNQELAGNRRVSFLIRATDDGFINYYSKESANLKPELVLMGGSGSELNDGYLVVRVDSIANTNANAKAGLMIRENLDANSKMAYVAQRPNNEVAFDIRNSTGGIAMHTLSGFGGGTAESKWLKLN
jgi:hypothetical protein